MTELRVTQPDAVTSRIYRIRGQRSTPVYPDERLTPEHCEILRDVNISERGIAQSRYGYTTYNATQIAGGEMGVGLWQGKFANGNTKQVLVTPTKVYSVTASAQVEITGSALTGGNDDRCRFVFLKDQVIFNNGVDAPRTWGGDDTTPTNTAALATVPWTKVKDILVHQNLLLALSPTEGGTLRPTRVRWCNINRQTYVVDVNTWGDADRYEIYDGGPAIVGGADAWGWAFIFKEDGVYPGRIVFRPTGDYDFQLGDPGTPMGPRRGFSPLSTLGIISRPEFVFCVAREGVVVIRPDFSMEIVNSDDLEEWFDLNQGRLQYAQSFIREKDHQVRTAVSSADNTSGHDFVLVWDWDTGDLWIDRPDDNVNYAQRVVVSNEELDWFAGTDGFLYQGNKSTYTTDSGTDISWRIKMAPNDLGLPGKLKHVLNVRTLHRKRTGAQSVTVRIYVDEGRQGTVIGSFVAGSVYRWNTGVKWNSGKKWPGAAARRADTYVNRICETIAPEWTGEGPASLEGYIVDFIPLEN